MTWIVGFQSVSFHGHSRLLFECICRRSKYSHREGHVLSFPIVTNVPLACLRRCLSQFEAGRRHNGTARLPSRGALQEDVAFVPRILVPSESLGDQMPLACTTLPTSDAVSAGCFTRSTGRLADGAATWPATTASLFHPALDGEFIQHGTLQHGDTQERRKDLFLGCSQIATARASFSRTMQPPVGGGALNLYMHTRGSRKHRERRKVATISRQRRRASPRLNFQAAYGSTERREGWAPASGPVPDEKALTRPPWPFRGTCLKSLSCRRASPSQPKPVSMTQRGPFLSSVRPPSNG
jgi:hypothetical protein